MDEVGKDLLAVHGDDGDALTVRALQPGVAVDVDFHKLERDLLAHGGQHPLGAFAEVAARRPVERDDALAHDYGYRPRVAVASATRPTAQT
jgi:hypothetical protein